jgi:hypothetical protein
MKLHHHLHTPTKAPNTRTLRWKENNEKFTRATCIVKTFNLKVHQVLYLFFWPFSPKYTFEFKFETWDSILFVHVGSGVPMHVLNIPVPKLGLLYCLVCAKNVAITSLRPCFSCCQVILNHPLLILARQLNIPFPRFFYMKKQPWERRHWASWWLQLMMAFSNMED